MRLETWRRPLLFLAAFLYLLPAVDPSFYADDSAEILTAAALLGIPHPPGYPLFTLLGRLAALLPLGGGGFRVNLLAALLACLNVALLDALLCRWVKAPAAWLLSLFWLVGAVSYPGALSAKTGLYQLASAILLALLLSLAEGRLEAAGALFGLGLACHWMTFLALAPGLLLFAWDQVPRDGKAALRALGWVLLGTSLYLYLPLRAARHPLLDWGEPVSWGNFWFDLSRAQYGGAGVSGSHPLSQAWALIKGDFLEWPGLLLVSGAGCWFGLRRGPRALRGLAAAWLIWSAALSFFLRLPPDRFYLLGGYALAGEALLLVLAAFAWKEVPEALRRRFAFPALALVLAFLALLRYGTARQTDYTYAYDYTLNSFQELPRGSLFFARGDSLVFPSWYFQWVGGLRPDLAVVGVDGLPMDWMRRTLAKAHPDLHVPESDERLGLESTGSLMRWLVERNQDRPLYLSFDSIDPQVVPGARLTAQGLVERVDRDGQGEAGDPDAPWARMRLRHWKDGSPVDARTALFFADNYSWRRNALGLSDEAEGDAWMARVKGPKAAENDLRARAAYGRALDEYTRAEEWYPREPKYAYNRGNALVKLGRGSEALDEYAKAWGLDPRYAEAYFNAAVAAVRLGQYQRAGGYLERVLAIDPGYPGAKENLDTLIGRGWYHP